MIGCDGGRSTVRKLAGIEFEGFTYPERFIKIATSFDFGKANPKRGVPQLLLRSERVVQPVQGAGQASARPVAHDLPDPAPTRAMRSALSPERIEARLQKFFPKAGRYEIEYVNVYGAHQCVAATFRKGRVLLAGDSAHVNNPIGGMGMNGGIHDGINLADKLARVIHGEAGDELLDLYSRQRRHAAVKYVQAQTIANKRLMEERDPAVRHQELRRAPPHRREPGDRQGLHAPRGAGRQPARRRGSDIISRQNSRRERAVINTLQSTAVIRALIGLVQGAALFLLYDAITLKLWPATNGELFAPLLVVALFVPMIVVAALDNMRTRTLAIWAITATVVCAGLAFYDIFRSPLEAYGGGLRPVPSPQFFIALAAGLFISHSLIAAGEAEHRWVASYPRYFDMSWKQGVQLVLAILFVGVFWGLLWLGAELFRLIKIETLSELIAKPWFAIPVTTLAITCALHVTDVRAGLVSGARTLKLTLLSWLLPMMAAFAVAFVLALPFTSIEPLWSTRRATSILLTAIAALVFLINAAYQDGRPETPVAAVLRVSRVVAALVIVPLVVLAAYGLSLRVRQYGWTPERITAAACVVVAACYAIGYAVVTLLSRGSLRGLEAVNVTTAFVIIGVLLALFSPVADPIRISVNDQVSRLEAGRLPSDQFDFGFLRFKAGRYGLAALDRLKSRQDGADAAQIAQKATEALALQRPVPGRPSAPVTAQKRSANIAVIYPRDQQILPEAFLQKDWSTTTSPWLLPQCLLHDVKCEAMLLDLDGDGAAEILLLPAQPGISAAFKMQSDGSWALLGQLQGWQCVGVREALREGKFEMVTPPLREIEVNGNRIRLSAGGCVPAGNPAIGVKRPPG